MPYRVVLSGQDNSKKKLGEKGILITSVPFFREEEGKAQKKIEQFGAAVMQLSTAVTSFDFMSTDMLLRYNFELLGQEPVNAKVKALALAQDWFERYRVESALRSSGACGTFLSWEQRVLQHTSYADLLQWVRRFYQENTHTFKQKVVKIAGDRLAFLSSREAIDPELALRKSIEYILEECAAVLVLRLLGEYQCLFYVQGKLNEATYDMATLHFAVDDVLFNTINQQSLKVVTVTCFDALSTRKQEEPPAPSAFLPAPLSSSAAALFKQKSTRKGIYEKNVQTERVALDAFFDSSKISEETKIDFLFRLVGAAPVPVKESLQRVASSAYSELALH